MLAQAPYSAIDYGGIGPIVEVDALEIRRAGSQYDRSTAKFAAFPKLDPGSATAGDGRAGRRPGWRATYFARRRNRIRQRRLQIEILARPQRRAAPAKVGIGAKFPIAVTD